MMSEQGGVKKDAETRVDRRRLRTRTALLGAGQRLFADRHIDGVTIDDIVEAADVAKGSFYNHFDGKESLADAIIELVQGDCEREVFAVNIDISDPAARVARAMAALIRYARQHPDRYQSMVNLAKRRADLNAPINAGARRDIDAGMASGQFSGITVEVGVLVMLSMIAQAVDYTTQNACSHTRVARDMAFMLLRALGVDSTKAGTVADEAIVELFNGKDA